MPSPGLSLVGFMDEAQAMSHLRQQCIYPETTTNAELKVLWEKAKVDLGEPIPRAGQPEILPLALADQAHIATLMQQPWIQPMLHTALLGASFQLVEIEPLLAFQFTIDSARSEHHCSRLTNPAPVNELLDICLPLTPQSENINVSEAPGSMMLTSRNLNFQAIVQGFINGAFLGMQVGMSLPLLHVVRHAGRCYLHNGFHRVLGARAAGATHVPCIFREVPDHASVGIKLPGLTFQPTLLESANPPAVGHFTQGRALTVTLRAFSRSLHVSWADHVTPLE